MGIGGTAVKANANKIAQRKFGDVANTSGLDVGKITGSALDAQLQYLPKGMDLASQISKANQTDVLGREESALPGAGAARGQALDNILKLFSDDPQWIQGLQRRGGVLGVRSGIGGSQANQIGMLKLSDTESQDRLTKGMGLLSALLSTLRISNSPGVENFLGPSPDKLIAIRAQERAQKMALDAQLAGMPGETSAWADYLTSAGGMVTGAGLMSMGDGGGGGGMAKSPPGYTGTFGGNVGMGALNSTYAGMGALGGAGMFGGCWIAREVFGDDNPQWLRFWAWKEFFGPRWFREWYAINGERFALWIANKPAQKARVRAWMERMING